MDTFAPLPNVTNIHLQKLMLSSLRSHVEIWLIGIRTGISKYFPDLIRQTAFTVGKQPQVFASIYIYGWSTLCLYYRDKASSPAPSRQLHPLYCMLIKVRIWVFLLCISIYRITLFLCWGWPSPGEDSMLELNFFFFSFSSVKAVPKVTDPLFLP